MLPICAFLSYLHTEAKWEKWLQILRQFLSSTMYMFQTHMKSTSSVQAYSYIANWFTNMKQADFQNVYIMHIVRLLGHF